VEILQLLDDLIGNRTKSSTLQHLGCTADVSETHQSYYLFPSHGFGIARLFLWLLARGVGPVDFALGEGT
jgi:hypothetical protein